MMHHDDDCEASMLLLLVAHASADDGHELIEHLHPEIAGMVRSFFNRKDSRPIQPNVDPGPIAMRDYGPDRRIVTRNVWLTILLGVVVGLIGGVLTLILQGIHT